ncbi:hypothetical protein ACOXBD_000147 [Escherichia coli]
MKTFINKIDEIGNMALFAENAVQVDKAAAAFKDLILKQREAETERVFTEEEQNIVGDALVKVRLAVGSQFFIDCLEKAGLVDKGRDIGLDSDEMFYRVEKETEQFVNGKLMHLNCIAFAVTPATISLFLYNLFTESAAQIIAANGEKVDVRRKAYEMVSAMVFTDVSGAAFTEDTIRLIKEKLEKMAEQFGNINQLKHTVH